MRHNRALHSDACGRSSLDDGRVRMPPNPMDTAERSRRQGHRLIQVGMLVFLLALLVGLAVPTFAVPRLGLSTHLLGITQGTFLMVVGALWPRLRLTRVIARIAFFLGVYG